MPKFFGSIEQQNLYIEKKEKIIEQIEKAVKKGRMRRDEGTRKQKIVSILIDSARSARIVKPAKGRPTIAERRKAEREAEKAEQEKAKKCGAARDDAKIPYFSTEAQNQVKLGLLEMMQKGVPLGYEAFRTALKLLRLWNS